MRALVPAVLPLPIPNSSAEVTSEVPATVMELMRSSDTTTLTPSWPWFQSSVFLAPQAVMCYVETGLSKCE